MGPITAIRIVNLRVREKVAYADLTLDLAGDTLDHHVIGLENGGGKSTLLGAVYHVFVPEADQFLPRRAQRRQKKEGELKELDQYIPGGEPTHFVVEVEAPTVDGILPSFAGPRVLLGACLWKPAGAPEGSAVKEFFWSARSATRELSLRDLAVRGPGGRLLDYREFEAKLELLRKETPAAQINIERGKGAWGAYLRSVGVDVEYVKQFLLRMNEDEGAADQVFTYASSRDFLNSLVGVVGDPTAIETLKQLLTTMGRDADDIVLDRKRVVLLQELATQTGAIAEVMSDLNEGIRERGRLLDYLLACRLGVAKHLEVAETDRDTSRSRREELKRLANEASTAYSDANARYFLAREQLARLRHAGSAQLLETMGQQREQARIDERVALAAALLAERRTSEARISEIDGILKVKAVAAEPLRLALSSGLQALDRRLAADLENNRQESRELDNLADEAGRDLDRAGQELTAATERLGVLNGERSALSSERANLERQLLAAVSEGVLSEVSSDPELELARVRANALAERSAAEEHERRQGLALAALEELARTDRELVEKYARSEAAFASAVEDLTGAKARTEEVTNTVVRSGFVDLDPLVLNDHLESIERRLEEVVHAARQKQASAAVNTAAAERAAMWLRDREHLPPRADVERLCARARSAGLGARPGWDYLASLPVAVAARHAAVHPGLADGIVVNVADDLEAVIAAATEARDELEGPLFVGPAGAFDSDHQPDRGATVVLPNSAYWSAVAGRELIEVRTQQATQWRAEYDDAIRRAEEALRTSEQLTSWATTVGKGGLERRRTLVQERAQAVESTGREQEALQALVEAKNEEHRLARHECEAARQRHGAASLLAQKLQALVPVRTRLRQIDDRLDAIQKDEGKSLAARERSRVTMADASRRKEEATESKSRLATRFGELREKRAGLAELAAVVVQRSDPVEAADEASDRELLAQQLRDRESRWKGAISDPQLRAQLEGLQSAIRDIERQLFDFDAVMDLARTKLAANPSRSADDYRNDAQRLRGRIETLGEQFGAQHASEKQLRNELEKIKGEYRALKRPVELLDGEKTEDTEAAETILEHLLSDRDKALIVRSTRDNEFHAAEETERFSVERVGIVEQSLRRVGAALKAGAAGAALVPAIEVGERAAELEIDTILEETHQPDWMVTLLRATGRSVDGTPSADNATASRALDVVDNLVERVQAQLKTLDSRAEAALEAAEARLRDAAEEVVRGDRIVQALRAAPRRTLADLAVAHHADIVQRLAAVQHHVDTFEARLDAHAATVFATVSDLLREVRRTVRESQLPNTPALGRWQGLELLHLTGLDSLRKEERRAAIQATIRTWFNPDHPEQRPRRFDGDDVVHDLLKAVTPQFTARILIPSDPLDPEHRPVDQLAKETSGGEGVTVALILASLLASRRASARGHRRTTLLLDNPFAKVTKPEFLRLARDVANELRVQLVAFTGIRDLGALTVFPRLTQLRVSRRENANFVVPYEIEDERLQGLLRNGTLYVSPKEWAAADTDQGQSTWPLMSAVAVARSRRDAPA